MSKNGSKINVSLSVVWKIAAVLFFLGAAYQTLWEIKPDVEKNTEHRIRFEEKVSTMETNIALILKEVMKE